MWVTFGDIFGVFFQLQIIWHKLFSKSRGILLGILLGYFFNSKLYGTNCFQNLEGYFWGYFWGTFSTPNYMAQIAFKI
jgi:hypothetical protein